MSTELITHPLLSAALELHPRVALRPEPFGALAYHYGNRRLVAVANSLAGHATFAEALHACGIDPQRWPSFVTAFASLQESHVVRERAVHEESPE